MRHGVLLGAGQHDLARQPVQQERLDLGRAHPQRPPEVTLAAVLHDVVGAAAGRLQVGQVLGHVRGQELGHQHGPPVLAPHLAAQHGGHPAGRRRAARAAAPLRQRGRQRPDPGPDERVVGGERRAHRGVGRVLRGGQRRGQQPPGLGRIDLGEHRTRRRRARRPGIRPSAAACRAPARRALGPRRRRGRRGAGLAALPAVRQQLADLGGDPAIAGQAARVVVDHHHQGVLLLAGVAEHADDLVAVAVGVGVHVALGRLDGADVVGPGRPGDAALHQLQGGLLGLGALPGGAQAGDAGQQGQGRGAALLGRVGDQPLADQLLDVGPAAPGLAHAPAAGLLAPPGAQQLGDHQLGVQRAAHGQQLAGGPQHLGEQRVGRGRGQAGPMALAGRPGVPGPVSSP